MESCMCRKTKKKPMGMKSARFWKEIKCQAGVYGDFNSTCSTLFPGKNYLKQIWQNVKIC